jgi:hypothetical protein
MRTKDNGVEDWTALDTTIIVAKIWATTIGQYVGTLRVGKTAGTDEVVGDFPVFFGKLAPTESRAGYKPAPSCLVT